MFKIGDTVKIKKGPDGPRAQLYIWTPAKDKYIGQIGTISFSSTVNGYYCVEFSDKTDCFFYVSCFELVTTITSSNNSANTRWTVPRDPAVRSSHHNFLPGDRVLFSTENIYGTVGNWINPDPKPRITDSFFLDGNSVPVLFDNGAKQNMAYHPYYICDPGCLELTVDQMIDKPISVKKNKNMYCSCGGPRKKSWTGLAGNGTEFEICMNCKKEADPGDALPF